MIEGRGQSWGWNKWKGRTILSPEPMCQPRPAGRGCIRIKKALCIEGKVKRREDSIVESWSELCKMPPGQDREWRVEAMAVVNGDVGRNPWLGSDACRGVLRVFCDHLTVTLPSFRRFAATVYWYKSAVSERISSLISLYRADIVAHCCPKGAHISIDSSLSPFSRPPRYFSLKQSSINEANL